MSSQRERPGHLSNERMVRGMKLLIENGLADQALKLGEVTGLTQLINSSGTKTPAAKPTISGKKPLGTRGMPASPPPTEEPKARTKMLPQTSGISAKKPASRVEIIRLTDCSPCASGKRTVRHVPIKPSVKKKLRAD